MEQQISIPTRDNRITGVVLLLGALFGIVLVVGGIGLFSSVVITAADIGARTVGALITCGCGYWAARMLTHEVEIRVANGAVFLVETSLGRDRVTALPCDERGCLILYETSQPAYTTAGASITIWAIVYEHPDGNFPIHRNGDEGVARALCERIAQAMNVPLVDMTK
ncbi:MAG: hypothetical protein H6833_11250 [Planctomycetes bacterium]|nr:hypothetical protein [Planctomycetota bacterium]